MKKKRWFVLPLLVLLALLLVPLTVNLTFFQQAVAGALTAQLGRTVEFSRLQVRLLPKPGLRAYGVKISELVSFGAEPFVHAEELYCQFKLASLVWGRLECAQVDLSRPSINLVRNAQGEWNLGYFLRQQRPAFPVLSADSARINFKTGAEKKVYALADARFRLQPRPGLWQVQLEAQPFRSDRWLTETGRVNLAGTIDLPTQPSDELRLQLSWELKRGALAHWLYFFTGRDTPGRAQVAFSGQVVGTVREAHLKGWLAVEDLHRWDLVAPRPVPRWEADCELKFAGQPLSLELLHAEVRSERSRLQAHGRIEDIFGQRGWAVEIPAATIHLDDLLALYSAFKANVSPETRLEGTARLTAKLVGARSRWTVAWELEQPGLWQVPRLAEPITVQTFTTHWQRNWLRLASLRMIFADDRVLELSGRLQPRPTQLLLRLTVRSQQLEIESLVAAARALGWSLWDEVEMRGQASLGLEWRGDLLAWGERRCWGRLELRDITLQPPELNAPLPVGLASVNFTGRDVRVAPLRLGLGKGILTGSIERMGSEGLWNLKVSMDRVNLADLDALLNPVHRQGLLAALLGRPRRRPDAWDKLHAQGHVASQRLEAGRFLLRRVAADGEWKERRLTLTRLRFHTLGGQFRGSFHADFHGEMPEYQCRGNLKEINLAQLLRTTAWEGLFSGHLGADVVLQTTGRRPAEWRRNLRGTVAAVITDGQLTHIDLLRAMNAAAESPGGERASKGSTMLQSLAGEFVIGEQRVRFAGARMIVDAAAVELSGEAGFDGRIDLRLRGELLRVADAKHPLPSPGLFDLTYQLRGTLKEPLIRVAETSGTAQP